jgi:hypothetical protein
VNRSPVLAVACGLLDADAARIARRKFGGGASAAARAAGHRGAPLHAVVGQQHAVAARVVKRVASRSQHDLVETLGLEHVDLGELAHLLRRACGPSSAADTVERSCAAPGNQ